jgi:hypothetical protein
MDLLKTEFLQGDPPVLQLVGETTYPPPTNCKLR